MRSLYKNVVTSVSTAAGIFPMSKIYFSQPLPSSTEALNNLLYKTSETQLVESDVRRMDLIGSRSTVI
jgi:hypothetical protein